MAGILNKKQRILDGIITTEGRLQMASGEMRIEFATFTDGAAFYDSTNGSSADDANARLYFEAADLPRDKIILESRTQGDLEVFRADQYTLYNGRPYLTGSSTYQTGSIKLLSEELTNFSTENFSNQNILGTRIPYRENIDDDFTVSKSKIKFKITDEMEFLDDMWIGRKSVEDLDLLFNDKMFGHEDAFRFLEPRYLESSQFHPAPENQKLADYSNISSPGYESLNEIYQILSRYPYEEIEFPKNSSEGNMIGQIIFCNSDKIGKLAIIDVGEFDNENPLSVGTRILHAGKFYRDRVGNLKFANIFTLVFE